MTFPPPGRAIWLLTTKDRPEMCQHVLDACQAHGASYGIVWADQGDRADEYENLHLPDGWALATPRMHNATGLAASMAYTYRHFPQALAYGWLADDTIPLTNGWAETLEGAAGDWCLSYANDKWLSSEGPEAVREGSLLTSGLCFGGELVRAVGAWAIPPSVHQATIDVAWCEIIRPLGLYRYLDQVLVEHRSYKNRKRERDATDELSFVDAADVVFDVARFEDWRAEMLPEVLERVLALLPPNLLREAPATASTRVLLRALADAREKVA